MGTCGRCDSLIRPVRVFLGLLKEGVEYFVRTKRYNLAALDIEQRVVNKQKRGS